MAQGNITATSAIFTISPEEQLPLLKDIATHLYRVDAFECVGNYTSHADGRRRLKAGKPLRCDCFDCQPLTMEQACIRYLAGQSVDFRFIEG